MTYPHQPSNNLSTCGREEWTSSPENAAAHVSRNFGHFERTSILRTWKLMSEGGDGGPIEPWGPSIRSVVYPDWSDADFIAAIDRVKALRDI